MPTKQEIEDRLVTAINYLEAVVSYDDVCEIMGEELTDNIQKFLLSIAKPPKKEEKKKTRLEELQFFCSGKVTVGTITQVVENSLVTSHVGKIRGKIVGNRDNYKFETKEDAREHARRIFVKWNSELEELRKGEQNAQL